MSMTKIDFELASAAGLSVCAGVDSTFSRQVSRLIAAVRAPLLAESESLRAELAALKAFHATRQTQPDQSAKGVPLALLIELRVTADICMNEAPAKHMRRAMDARNALDVILAPLLTQEVAVL